MNKAEMIMLRLMILGMKKLGYSFPLLKEARPIRTGKWSIYRHYGRLIRLRPMKTEKLNFVRYQQKLMDDNYKHRYNEEKLAFARKTFSEKGVMPPEEEINQYMLLWEQENPWPEFRPCDTCALMKGRVIPCPYYNVIAGSQHHACCTHDYEIIKDAPMR